MLVGAAMMASASSFRDRARPSPAAFVAIGGVALGLPDAAACSLLDAMLLALAAASALLLSRALDGIEVGVSAERIMRPMSASSPPSATRNRFAGILLMACNRMLRVSSDMLSGTKRSLPLASRSFHVATLRRPSAASSASPFSRPRLRRPPSRSSSRRSSPPSPSRREEAAAPLVLAAAASSSATVCLCG